MRHTDTVNPTQEKPATAGVNQLQESLLWDWQKASKQTVNDIPSLATLLELDTKALPSIVATNDFELRVPMPFVNRMEKGNINDPLLKQILPTTHELDTQVGFTNDPLNEQHYNSCPGLIHKYASRVLLTAAVSCPINCRYCFRRHFPYADNRLNPKNWQAALDYIANNDSIKEVILSGGEPLLLNDRMLSALLDKIESIEHVKLIRIHTRFPVVVPQRLTATLCTRLSTSRCKISMVMHINHPNEIDEHFKRCVLPLITSPVTLLNQSVLLKSINDDIQTLTDLSYTLFDAGLLPYYLHATDPVSGTAHFTVSDDKAQQLVSELTASLPGYLVPTLVREVSGKQAKTRLPITAIPSASLND